MSASPGLSRSKTVSSGAGGGASGTAASSTPSHYAELANVPLTLTIALPEHSAKVSLPNHYAHGIPHNVAELYTVDLDTVEGILAHVTRERGARRAELEGRKARLEGKQNALRAEEAEPGAADTFRRAIGLTLLGTLLKGRRGGDPSAAELAASFGPISSGAGSVAALAPPLGSAGRERILQHQAAMRARLQQSQQQQHAFSALAPAGQALGESPPPPPYSMLSVPLPLADLRLQDPAPSSSTPSFAGGSGSSSSSAALAASGSAPPAIPPKPERRPSPEVQRFMDMGFAQEGVELVLTTHDRENHHRLLDYMFLYTELRRTFPHSLVAQGLEPPCKFATAAEATPFLTDLQRLLEFGFPPTAVKRALLRSKTFEAALELLMADGEASGR